jgi:dephospho-CoA kinase
MGDASMPDAQPAVHRRCATSVRAVTTRVLLTGVSGTGKSTLVAELHARGHHAVDADEPTYSHEVAAPDGELTGLGPGRDWVWDEVRVAELLASDVDLLFVSGCSPNQGMFYDRFDHVVLLTAPPEVVARRLATRTTNPFGKRSDEAARALELHRAIEPRLRAGADLQIDTNAPLDEVVATLLDHVTPPH